MVDKTERAQKFEVLLESDGWHEFVAATKEEMFREVDFVMNVPTQGVTFNDLVAHINRYQALKKNIEMPERLVTKDRERREKKESSGK